MGDKAQTNIRLCQLEQSVTQFGHLGMGPVAITQNRSQPVEGFMSWQPGEQLTRLLLAPQPEQKQMPRTLGRLGKQRGPRQGTYMFWERITSSGRRWSKAKAEQRLSICSDILHFFQPRETVRTLPGPRKHISWTDVKSQATCPPPVGRAE